MKAIPTVASSLAGMLGARHALAPPVLLILDPLVPIIGPVAALPPGGLIPFSYNLPQYVSFCGELICALNS